MKGEQIDLLSALNVNQLTNRVNMKNKFKIGFLTSMLVLVLLFTQNANAQLLPELGIKGGVNLATINNTNGAETKTGLLAGAYIRIIIPASPMAIQPELLFAQYGANVEGSDNFFTLDYIQVPVLLKFGFGIPAAPIRPNVFFGPYMGFNTKAELEDGTGNSLNIDQFVKDIDFGVVVGAGLDVSKFRLGLRYTAGLTNLYEDDFEDGEKNGAIALTVGIAF